MMPIPEPHKSLYSPEQAPQGESDLEIRIKHFTEIENFGFLGFVLAHELGVKSNREYVL